MNEVTRSLQAKQNAAIRLELLRNKDIPEESIKDVALFQAEQEIIRLREELIELEYNKEG